MKILFINHSASRTGAPIVLLHFLKWLKTNTEVRFDVLTLQDKDLLDDFSEVSDVHFFHKNNELYADRILRGFKKIFKKETSYNLKYPLRKLNRIAKSNYDLIYANSVVSLPIASYLKNKSPFQPKLLVHFHELNLTIQKVCSQLHQYKKNIDHSLAASNKVKNNLIENWGFDDKRIEVIYEHSLIPKVLSTQSDSFIVGGSGQVYWRKGPDFFILVADYVLKKLPNANIKFQWIGRISGVSRQVYEDDLRKLNIEHKVEFTGVKANPYEYFSNFDVFLMTSKEDPFPLVCIEIGMMGIPMICFEGATGTEEVLENVKDTVVPYLDIAAMGDVVISYYHDAKLKLEKGEQMKTIFNEFTPEKQSRKIYNEVLTLIENSME